ncbi:MAG: hypothetical protein LH478_12335 [Chitinophagaceae bacterium]|nr:hypothetical protein [Chitinophagaceae bacterium]
MRGERAKTKMMLVEVRTSYACNMKRQADIIEGLVSKSVTHNLNGLALG